MAPNKTLEESDASMRKRLVESLSQSFPGSALSKALHSMDPDDPSDDPLSSSCFAELRLEQGPLDEDDDELTSLSWLQDSNLVKSIGGDEGIPRLCMSPTEDDDVSKENDDKNDSGYATGHPASVPYNPQKHVTSKPPYSFSCLIFMAIEDSPIKKLPVKDIYNWILTHFPYFQNAPTGWKNSVRHNLSLNKCFKKVEKEKGQTIGKGSLWCIDPDYRPNLLQALRKTPYHPYHQLQMLATPTPNAGYTILSGTPKPLLLSNRLNLNTPSPHLFPFLSRRLAQSKVNTESDIDVANTLVSLKRAAEQGRPLQCKNGWYNGRRSRSPSPPEFGSERERELLKAKYRSMYRSESAVVICSHPSEDHTYSVARVPQHPPPSPGSDVDEEYDWGSDDEIDDSFSDTSADSNEYSECDSDGEGRVSPGKRKRKSYGAGGVSSTAAMLTPPVKRRFIASLDEDDVQGADALLNLAGIRTAGVPSAFRSHNANNNNNNNSKDHNAKTLGSS